PGVRASGRPAAGLRLGVGVVSAPDVVLVMGGGRSYVIADLLVASLGAAPGVSGGPPTPGGPVPDW
ncbi:MAG: hypothetical protein LH650_11555, partial [Chloroflexi bacterium]|nr:hypothetical protein [Chloroflexota bacterium]